MPYFLKYVDFLEDLSPTVVVLDVDLVYTLDGNVLPSQLVDSKRDLSKGPLAEQFDKLVVIKGRMWQSSILLNMGFVIPDQTVSLLSNIVV